MVAVPTSSESGSQRSEHTPNREKNAYLVYRSEHGICDKYNKMLNIYQNVKTNSQRFKADSRL